MGGRQMARKTAKSVSFNLDKKEEQMMWKYVSRRNFSRYVKKLILEDMNRKQAEKTVEKAKKEQPKKEKMATPNQVTFQQANVSKPFIPKSLRQDR
jgi:hypothetical protein